jgi:cell division protein FtsI/penicillin-binding protein 2
MQQSGIFRGSRRSVAVVATVVVLVVAAGAATGVGFPPGVYGKTGTAQYGNGPNPPSHGWFIGYRGDVAFAVLVEGGGTGADSAGPIANAFLRNLP